LTLKQRQSLARQGWISEERRGSRKRVFKLRFRHEGRLVVRYLTTDPRAAERARRELADMQKRAEESRELRGCVRAGRRALREAKAKSLPFVQDMGLMYHGYQLRRPRGSTHCLKPTPSTIVDRDV
jgi:hypothetical protein